MLRVTTDRLRTYYMSYMKEVSIKSLWLSEPIAFGGRWKSIHKQCLTNMMWHIEMETATLEHRSWKALGHEWWWFDWELFDSRVHHHPSWYTMPHEREMGPKWGTVMAMRWTAALSELLRWTCNAEIMDSQYWHKLITERSMSSLSPKGTDPRLYGVLI